MAMKTSFWAVVGTLIAIGVCLRAQSAPHVIIAVSDRSVATSGDAVWEVTVTIPPGYFIPAETTPDMQAAWLQTTVWVFDNPRYPTPRYVRLSSGSRVLAYEGTIRIATPVRVDSRISSIVRLRFGYQLCRASACEMFTVEDADTRADFRNATSPSDERLAFAIDGTQVAVVLDSTVALSSDAKSVAGPNQFAGRLLEVPDGHAALASLQPQFRPRAEWMVLSNGTRYRAVVERHAGLQSSCGDFDNLSLALVLRVLDRDFQNEQAQFFVAVPADSTAAIGTKALGPVPVTLSNSQRPDLEELIRRQMRATLPWFYAPDPRGLPTTSEPPLLRLLQQVGARPSYHIEGFKLAPDDDVRLYVRAYWTPSPPPVGITLWLRFDGKSFIVEGTDARVSRFALMRETKDFDLGGSPEYGGVILNVVPARDGWALILQGATGYEGKGVSLLKYSPVGPRNTGVGFGYGC
jgi:hypothetical protein